MKKRAWIEEERAIMRREFANTRTEDLAVRLGRTASSVHQEARNLGLRKNPELIRSMARERTMCPGHGSQRTRFGKGHVPANQGLRRPGWAPGRMKATQFKKGERRGVAAENYCPIGTIKADSEGYLRIKVRDAFAGERTGFGNVKVWPLLQRHVWEQHNGPIPKGHNVVFRDGDRSNCAIENLELVSRAEMMRRNTIHRYPEELRNTIMLLGALKRKVREHAEKHND